MNKDLLGIIVCGGQSTRMGSDKGLLTVEGKTWAEHVAVKLTAAGISVMYSINKNQEEAYTRTFLADRLIVDHFDIGGPMNGLLSAHQKFPQRDIFFMACDMLDIETETVKTIIAAYEKNKNFDFYAFEAEKVVQPFCAIYRAKALNGMLQKLEQQSLVSSSMRYTLENGNTCRITTSNSSPFTNYNTLDQRNDFQNNQ